jgi:hypothetical protein
MQEYAGKCKIMKLQPYELSGGTHITNTQRK